MNLYILVEGNTEAKIFPEWLQYLAPQLQRVTHAADAAANNYYLFNARGYPNILNTHLPNAIEEVNALGQFDYLLASFDSDEEPVACRSALAFAYLAEAGHALVKGKLVLCLQNACIETWFLGNRPIFKRNPDDPLLRKYVAYYNVAENDPEEMGNPPFFDGERQQFHKAYFKRLARERHMAYRENRPGQAGSETFLTQLKRRRADTGHLTTFGNLMDFIEYL